MTLDPPPVSPWHGSVHRQSTDTSSYSQLKVKVSSRWHLHTSLDMSTVVAKTKSCKLFMQICQVKPSIKAIWMLIQNKSCPFQWQEANISTPGSSHMLEFASFWVRMCDKQKYIRNIHGQYKIKRQKCATWQLSSPQELLHSQQSTPHAVTWKLLLLRASRSRCFLQEIFTFGGVSAFSALAPALAIMLAASTWWSSCFYIFSVCLTALMLLDQKFQFLDSCVLLGNLYFQAGDIWTIPFGALCQLLLEHL